MAPSQENVDELFEIKNSFYIGNYQQCINEAQKLKITDPDIDLERNIFLYRSYIALQKYRIVLDEITGLSNPKLSPLKLLAEYLSTKNKDVVVSKLDDIVAKDVDASNHTLVIVAATIYANERNYESALRILNQADFLEASAITLQLLIQMDRLDLAKKQWTNLQTKDEDATLSQLAQAWLNIALGGAKLDDAYYIFQEMIDKHGATPNLLNGQATCCIHLGRYEEADASLQECISKNPNHAEALVNMVVLAQQGGRASEVAHRHLLQLQDSHSTHPYVREIATKESDFDRVAHIFGTS